MRADEFGSDFHYVDSVPQSSGTTTPLWASGNLYANGRQAIKALIAHRGWSRIWMPRYFCYEVVDSIATTGIELLFYDDYPTADDCQIIDKIAFRNNDVLFRMNYFGLRAWRDNSTLSVEVIEDHSHALIGDWIDRSNADWCIASLRKSMPLSQGGVLWSPKGLMLPMPALRTEANDQLASIRWQAMELKREYLAGRVVDKADFRRLYIQTESDFELLPISAIYAKDRAIVASIDIVAWSELKKRNFLILNQMLSGSVEILQPENEHCIPFSLVIRGQHIKDQLVKESIYPAILWPVAQGVNRDLLSIHCDGRYSESMTMLMGEKIVRIIEQSKR